MTEYFGKITKNLQIICSADFPEEELDLACLPIAKSGNAELTRDQLQQAADRLKTGGELWTSVDNSNDTWLLEEMKKLFSKVTVINYEQGKVYHAVKGEKGIKLRDFTAEYKVRDHEQLLEVHSLPGVFGHREIDLGARAMMEAMEIKVNDRVLDIGCGTGICGLAAAKRAMGIKLTAYDSNARAVACSRKNLELNAVTNGEVLLNYDGCRVPAEEFDVVLANPPYFSHFRISKIFVDTGHRLLSSKGRLYLVTKLPDWYRAYLPILFNKIEEQELRGYTVFCASQPEKNLSCPDESEE